MGERPRRRRAFGALAGADERTPSPPSGSDNDASTWPLPARFRPPALDVASYPWERTFLMQRAQLQNFFLRVLIFTTEFIPGVVIPGGRSEVPKSWTTGWPGQGRCNDQFARSTPDQDIVFLPLDGRFIRRVQAYRSRNTVLYQPQSCIFCVVMVRALI